MLFCRRVGGCGSGNVVHNYKSCLDHIAWETVKRGHRPPSTLKSWQKRGVYFPICLTRKDFNESLDVLSSPKRRPKLPGVRRADVTKVRRYQPYKSGETVSENHALSVLERLSRLDKHREIQPVAGFAFGGKLTITYSHDCRRSPPTTRSASRSGGKLEVGTEFAYVYVKKAGPNPEMSVQAALDVKPSIDRDFWLNEWLAKIERQVALILTQFSEPPKKLLEGLKPPA